MEKIKQTIQTFKNLLDQMQDIPLLAIRFLLALGFYFPAMEKWNNMEATIAWFGNEDWGLGLPFPELQAYLAATTEILGVWMLIFGIGTRLISIPLIGTMVVAILTVHIDHGWYVIGQSALNPEIAERIGAAKGILKEHGNYNWLTDKGSFVILQNGVETVVTYIILLLTLVTKGPGRISLDYFVEKKLFDK
ncbi:DoxX family protein [bacterium SCSIO 12643]|nr:DoxX family protein [bacterium SCSIO 12643]